MLSGSTTKRCPSVGKQNDDGSRTLFESMIRDEEKHVDYLQVEIHWFEKTGIANCLSRKWGRLGNSRSERPAAYFRPFSPSLNMYLIAGL